jgi:hypothetical protein
MRLAVGFPQPGRTTMITVNGTIDSLQAAPEALEAEGQAGVETRATGDAPKQAQIVVTASEGLSTGSVTLIVPAAATGGLAVGPCRIMIESA